jgi:hypothetical protein
MKFIVLIIPKDFLKTLWQQKTSPFIFINSYTAIYIASPMGKNLMVLS